jgi:ABC-type multidrug transport system fused ATPase/permease subunit
LVAALVTVVASPRAPSGNRVLAGLVLVLAAFGGVGAVRRARRRRSDKPGSALSRSWKLLPRAFPYLRPYRGKSALSVALTVLSAAAALAEPIPFAFIIDTVLSQRDPPEWLTSIVGDSPATLIIVAVLASLALTLATGGLTVVNEYLTTSVDQRMVLDFRSDLFRHVQRLSLTFHDNMKTGQLMYRVNDQADSLGQIIVALPSFAQSFLTLVGMLYITYRIDPYLALLAMAVVPVVYYSTTLYANRVEPQLQHVRRLEGENLAIVHEAMAMLRVIVTFGRERHEYDRFRAQGERSVDARVKLTVRETSFQLLVGFITAFGTAAVLALGAFQVLRDEISGGQLVIVLSYVAAVYAPLETMTNSVTSLQQQFISFGHALGLLDTAPEITEKPDAEALGRARGELTFERVSFGYKGRGSTLKSLSFHLPAGQALAIIGPTGAGKSTLASLIPRLYDAGEGCVCIDGWDVRDLTLESLRAQFSIVLQEPLLFAGSIADNIGYGRLGATQEEIEQAAKDANAHDFITALPKSYATELGERGAKISGGERQRLAVARAFLRDAPILILDEPTSSIDSRTEGVILEALDRLMVGRTTVMIAHRLSTVRRADKILVLNHGELVEQGTHDELLQRPSLYRQLWEAQTRHVDQPNAAKKSPNGVAKEPDIEQLAAEAVSA